MFENVAIPFVIHYALLQGIVGSIREERVVTATAAIQQAQKIQLKIQKTQKCLSELSGWNRKSRHWPGELATRVRDSGDWLIFECDSKRKEFWVTIHYGFDDVADVSGPFDGPLTIKYGHPSAPESKVIPPDPDIRALAELIASGGS